MMQVRRSHLVVTLACSAVALIVATGFVLRGGDDGDDFNAGAARAVIATQDGIADENAALDTVRDLCTRDVDDTARATLSVAEQTGNAWYVPAMQAACPAQLARLRD